MTELQKTAKKLISQRTSSTKRKIFLRENNIRRLKNQIAELQDFTEKSDWEAEVIRICQSIVDNKGICPQTSPCYHSCYHCTLHKYSGCILHQRSVSSRNGYDDDQTLSERCKSALEVLSLYLDETVILELAVNLG